MLCTSHDSRNGPTLAGLAYALILLTLGTKRELFVPRIERINVYAKSPGDEAHQGHVHCLRQLKETSGLSDACGMSRIIKNCDLTSRSGCSHSISRLAFCTRVVAEAVDLQFIPCIWNTRVENRQQRSSRPVNEF